jgi:hypothetical protein
MSIRNGISRMPGAYTRPDRSQGRAYRYTRWIKRKDQSIVAEELYDYEGDPDETTDWAATEHYSDVLGLLRKQSAAG